MGTLKLSKMEPLHIIKFMNSLTESGTRIDHRFTLKDEYVPCVKENKKLLCDFVNERTIADIIKGRVTNGITASKIAEILKKHS